MNPQLKEIGKQMIYATIVLIVIMPFFPLGLIVIPYIPMAFLACYVYYIGKSLVQKHNISVNLYNIIFVSIPIGLIILLFLNVDYYKSLEYLGKPMEWFWGFFGVNNA